MKIVGITGGMGSGKTTVCRIFERLGVPVFYADDEAKKILFEDKAVFKKVRDTLGPGILTDGKPDKKKIAAEVFSDDKKLKALNAVIHPAVQKKFSSWCKIKKNEKYVLKEAAILFESGSHKECDLIITVSAPEHIRIDRAGRRDKLSAQEIKKRMEKQLPEEERNTRSDFVIINDNEQLVIPQVIKIHEKIRG